MLAYLISRKHVPTKMGEMYFGIWIDINGDFFDTAHFADCLKRHPFQGGGCYLLSGNVEVDYHFPTITITKIRRCPSFQIRVIPIQIPDSLAHTKIYGRM